MRMIKTKTHTILIPEDHLKDEHKELIWQGVKTFAIIQGALMLFALIGGI